MNLALTVTANLVKLIRVCLIFSSNYLTYMVRIILLILALVGFIGNFILAGYYMYHRFELPLLVQLSLYACSYIFIASLIYASYIAYREKSRFELILLIFMTIIFTLNTIAITKYIFFNQTT